MSVANNQQVLRRYNPRMPRVAPRVDGIRAITLVLSMETAVLRENNKKTETGQNVAKKQPTYATCGSTCGSTFSATHPHHPFRGVGGVARGRKKISEGSAKDLTACFCSEFRVWRAKK